jgi:glutathione S-transferase
MGSLYPASLETRAHAERWMDWQLSTLVTPVSIVFWNLIRTPDDRRDAAAVAKNTAEANRVLERLDGELRAQPYVAGSQLTMGDIPVGAVVHRWLALPGVERPAFPALRAWYDRLVERPAYRAHVMLPLS